MHGSHTGTVAPGPGIVFACIAPHGELAIGEADTAGATPGAATRRAMVELGRRFDAAAPDTVVVLTPLGIHVGGHVAIVVAGRVAGSLAEAPAIALDLPADRHLAAAILDALAADGIPAVPVSYGGNDPGEAVMPLDWGSLIPLWHLGGRREPPTPVVLVSPARDLPVTSHVAAGASIARAIAACGRRAALVASADQAHTHAADGPYGFDPAAAVFDALVLSTLREGRLGALAGIDPALVEAAKPDSWWQMLMLSGALDGSWTPEVLSSEVPTYYGMLCADFVRANGAATA